MIKNPNHYYAEQWYRVSGVCYDENGKPNKYLNEKVTDATRTSDNPVIFLSKEIFELGKLEQQTENNYFLLCIVYVNFL